jgi:hypothetical protein
MRSASALATRRPRFVAVSSMLSCVRPQPGRPDSNANGAKARIGVGSGGMVVVTEAKRLDIGLDDLTPLSNIVSQPERDPVAPKVHYWWRLTAELHALCGLHCGAALRSAPINICIIALTSVQSPG